MERRSKGEGTIELRLDGRWQGRVRVEVPSGHKRISIYGRTRGEVSRKIAAIRQKQEDGELSLTKSEPLREYLNEWWPTGYGIKTATYKVRELNVRRINNIIGNIPLDQVSIRHIKMLDKHLREKGSVNEKPLSASGRKQALAVLRSALGAAYAEDRIPRDPFRKWRRENTPQAVQREKRVLTMTEKSKLFSLNDEWTDIWKIQMTTGNRIGETLALTWADLDLPDEEDQNGIMRISKAIHRRRQNSEINPEWLGYGDTYYIDKPKTIKSTRTNAIAPHTVQLFKRVKARQESKGSGNPEGFVFTRLTAKYRSLVGKPITPDIAWYFIQAAMTKLGLGHVRVHDLRHTMITDQLNAGIAMEKVSKVVGHSSVAFTSDVYGKKTNEMEIQVAEAATEIIRQAERLAELQGVTNA